MKKNHYKNTKKVFDYKTKIKFLSICVISYLLVNAIMLFNAPIILSVLSVLSLALTVIVYKKKTVEEKQIDNLKNVIEVRNFNEK